MRWQLPRRGNLWCAGQAGDFRELRQLFVCNRTASQDRDSSILNSDNCRLNAVLCPSGIDDQWDPSVQFIQHMLRCCRTDASEAICARGSERFIQFTCDFSEHGMYAESHRHSTQSRRNNLRNHLQLRQNHRERPGPKFVGQVADQLSIARWHLRNSVEPLAIRKVNDKRIEAWPIFRFENFRNGYRVERASSESVNSFRRQPDKVAFAQQFNRRSAVG